MMIIYTVIILCVLIFVHELGHFMACKALGVKVNEFALGMGPAFFKKQGKETLYSLRAFPIGGYCAMEGEDENSNDSKAFSGKPAWAKAIILAAGSLMNVVLAIVILSGILLYNGTATTTIQEVSPASPAQEAGLLPGDTIKVIEGSRINSWADVINAVSQSGGETFAIEVERDGESLTFETGTVVGEDGRKVIGIRPEVKHNPAMSLARGAQESFLMVKNMIGLVGQLFTGGVPASDLTGPVGIAHIVDDTAKEGMRYVLYLVALISLNLAIVNMLPFPALDGGRLLFLAIRLMTGKAISDKAEARIHLIGLMLLLVLMVYVTWNDVGRFILGTIG